MSTGLFEIDNRQRYDNIQGATFADALMLGGDQASVVIPGSKLTINLDGLRSLMEKSFHVTVSQFMAMSGSQQNQLINRIRRRVEQTFRREYPEEWAKLCKQSSTEKDAADKEYLIRTRTALHNSLRTWADGPLTLQRPSGSSYHHLLEYDLRVHVPGNPTMVDIAAKYGEPERVVVENDWSRAMAGKDIGGEVRMPWPHVCWEFRISGVRVLCFVRTEVDQPCMFCVYGRDDNWVADDYVYLLDDASNMLAKHAHTITDIDGGPLDRHEFPRVNAMVWSQVRAACILLDVQAACRERVVVSPKLVRQRQSQGKPAPREYEIVRLARKARSHVARSTGGGAAGARAPQRGHLRRGTWVHYDDVDSGDVKYVSDGGFWKSKTWRRWHWAGDLSNMIEREYRL